MAVLVAEAMRRLPITRRKYIMSTSMKAYYIYRVKRRIRIGLKIMMVPNLGLWLVFQKKLKNWHSLDMDLLLENKCNVQGSQVITG